MANKDAFNIVGLDFDDAKESLKQFLMSQDTLKDYNFDGSVLSTVLDVLAYNTHYQAFYANMIGNEMFLDSAVMRSSVASHAKALGYIPSSRRAAKAVLSVSAPGSSDNTYLSRGSEFVGVDGAGTQHRFVLLDTVYAKSSSQSFEDISVYEGTLRRMSYIYDPTRTTGSYLLIPNDKIDTSTIRVRVKASATDNTGVENSWKLAESYIDLTPTSKVYFLQEKEQGMYELFFGDNFLGQQPLSGNVVIVEYLETNADQGNGIDVFSCSVAGTGAIAVDSISSGGALGDNSGRIKFLAPRFYKSQSRAVTEDDYTASVLKDYPNTDSVIVYGGETTDPPQYGKVFVAVKPKSGSALTLTEKLDLVNKLKKNRSVITITPEIVDPDYIDVIIDSLVTYDPNLISVGAGTLKALVVAYAYSFSSASMEAFGSNFYLSRFIQGINNLSSGILSNETKITLRKTINLSKLLASKGFSVDFRNPLEHPHDGHSAVVKSTLFSHKNVDGFFMTDVSAIDDGFGNMKLVRVDSNGQEVLVYPKIGTVDYDNGIVKFSTSFAPTSTGSFLTLTVEPKNTDVYVFENKILRISRGYSDSVSVSLKTSTARKNTLKD